MEKIVDAIKKVENLLLDLDKNIFNDSQTIFINPKKFTKN